MSARGSIVVLLFALIGLIGGLGWLINLRFESGEAYPPRSSLRPDPLGAKALHDAYTQLPGREARRNFVPLRQIQSLPSDASLLFLNAGVHQMRTLDNYDVVHEFVERGGRLVIALSPDRMPLFHSIDSEASESDANSEQVTDDEAGRATEDQAPADTRRRSKETPSFREGIFLRFVELEKRKTGEAQLVADPPAADLPERLPWREGGTLLIRSDDVWSPIYQVNEAVVVAQRSFGQGSIIVLTDDYLFSNEAMLKHRYASLLAWVIGEPSKLIFEETHLGVAEGSGVANLMRRYRLEGLVIAFAGWMALIVWRGHSPMLPAFNGRARDQVIRSEHSAEDGLRHLIDRSLVPSDMPQLAFEAWQQSFIRTEADRRFYAEEISEIEQLLRAQASLRPLQRLPVDTHLKIKSIIHRKKRRRQ